MQIHLRKAEVNDIPLMKRIRLAVKENVLHNPYFITDQDYNDYLFKKGQGWVALFGNQIVGFAIIDTDTASVWALFTDPYYEGMGVGSGLQRRMLEWHFSNSNQKLWLTTSADTRAEKFYKKSGWVETQRHFKTPADSSFPPYTEITFEITAQQYAAAVKNLMG